MLIQVHLQDIKTGSSEFVAQKKTNSNEESSEFVKVIMNRYGRPPEGKQWMACNEESQYFKWMVTK